MSVAAETRRAVHEQPFVHEALRAGVINYTAAARFLDVGEPEPVAAALRRYAEALPDPETASREARVTMRSGIGPAADADPEETVLAVGDTAFADGGSLTGVLATGAVDPAALGHVLSRFAVEDIDPEAAGVAGDALVVVVGRRDAPDAVRVVEDALSAVPVTGTPTD